MENAQTSSSQSSSGRGQGRGKSRGGLGKYLRARGRGHRGRGRGAVWNERLLLEDEQEVEIDDEEVAEMQQKYSRRQMGTNADRYVEPEPKLDSDGEAIAEPEVDLSSFLERQRLADDPPSPRIPDETEDVDTSLPVHSVNGIPQNANTKKGKVQQIEWDTSLEDMSREKAAADATRDLKARFREHTANERAKPRSIRGARRGTNQEAQYVQAPALPTDPPPKPHTEKDGMEGFLDDLLG